MRRLIDQKLNELQEIFPDNYEFRTWVMQSDLWNWIYNIMVLNGEKVHKTAIAQMVQGQINEDIPLWRYKFAQSFKEVYLDMDQYISMDTDLDLHMICKWARLLCDQDEVLADEDLLRQNHTVVYEWDLIPVEENKVKDSLKALLKDYKLAEGDDLYKAVRLHMELNRLYPFGENSVLISMTVLMYCLKKLKMPLPLLSVNDIEYNRMMVSYVEDGDSSAFQNMLERSVYNRIENVYSLAVQTNENE